mmetsp:Transcript_21094/g.36021  ORF Transcript_21094/g.36021 Transcript_21094/m.36021 type:complete len:586 (+) Transcript_21094:121-1878(+)
MVEHNQPPSTSEPSSPSSMDRLLILAAVSQRAQSEQMGTPPPEEEESSTALISKDSPCISDATAADDASKNTAVSDGRAVTLLSPKGLPQAITTNTGSAGPTTFTLNGNEDIMKGLYQVKIPPLHGSEEPLPPMTQNKKRKVSDGTRDAMMYGGRLHAASEIVKSTPASFSAVPAPPLGMNGGGYHQDSNAVVGGAAASTPMLGHNYHQQIMAMSVAGLSAPNMMSMVQGRPQPQQMQMIQHQQKAKMQTVIPSDEGPLKKKKKRKKKDVTTRRAATTARDVPKYTTTTKDGKPIVFPNQDIFSEILQKKAKSSPEEAEALAEQMMVPFYNTWKEEKSKRKRPATLTRTKEAAAAPPTSAAAVAPQELAAQIAPNYSKWRDHEAPSMSAATAARRQSTKWNPSLSVEKAESGFMYQDQEESLMIQNRMLQLERTVLEEQNQQRLHKYMQQQQRRTQDVSLERMPSNSSTQAYNRSNLPTPLPRLSAARQMAHQQDVAHFSQDDPNLQVKLSLLELENQLRAEEHDLILQSSQRQMSELHQHAVQLEERMKLSEMDFMRERKRMVNMQTVNRLRLQADELEKRLMM